MSERLATITNAAPARVGTIPGKGQAMLHGSGEVVDVWNASTALVETGRAVVARDAHGSYWFVAVEC